MNFVFPCLLLGLSEEGRRRTLFAERTGTGAMSNGPTDVSVPLSDFESVTTF